MRLDKFLKNARLIKRRPLAKDVCEQGRVFINGQKAKASSQVQEGDELMLRFTQKILTVTVEKLLQTSKKDDAEKMYSIKAEEIASSSEEKE